MFGTASYGYDVLDNLPHVGIGGTGTKVRTSTTATRQFRCGRPDDADGTVESTDIVKPFSDCAGNQYSQLVSNSSLS